MNKKQLLIGIVLADFVALNVWVLSQYGYVGIMREIFSTWPGILAFVDLTIALSMIFVWMWNDARQRGVAVVPYMVGGLLLGSIGPLLYLLRISGNGAPAANRVGALAASGK